MRHKSYWRFWLAVVLTLGSLGYATYFAASRPSVHSMQYDQFLAVMLTALGIVLAALALLVALAAFLGYQKISEIAAEEARKAAVEAAEEFFGGFPSKPSAQRRPSNSQMGKMLKSITLTPQDTEAGKAKERKTVARKYPAKGSS